MQRDSNIFEHDYIIESLEMFAADLKTGKSLSSIIDKQACILTAFMQGQILAVEKQTLSDCMKKSWKINQDTLIDQGNNQGGGL